MSDAMKFEVLSDGTIKLTSDEISMPNHANAEAFFRLIAQLSGGEVEQEKRKDIAVREVTKVVQRFRD
jgi:hypothetical protein